MLNYRTTSAANYRGWQVRWCAGPAGTVTYRNTYVAIFNQPTDLAFSNSSNTLYIAEHQGIRKVDISKNTVSTYLTDKGQIYSLVATLDVLNSDALVVPTDVIYFSNKTGIYVALDPDELGVLIQECKADYEVGHSTQLKICNQNIIVASKSKYQVYSFSDVLNLCRATHKKSIYQAQAAHKTRMTTLDELLEILKDDPVYIANGVIAFLVIMAALLSHYMTHKKGVSHSVILSAGLGLSDVITDILLLIHVYRCRVHLYFYLFGSTLVISMLSNAAILYYVFSEEIIKNRTFRLWYFRFR